MARPMRLANRTAVVTGAASGIGRAIAISLARRHCHLALVDIDEAGMTHTAALLAPYGVRVSCHCIDVSDAAAVAALPEAVCRMHGGVDLLFNNAGVAMWGNFDQVSDADFEWLFNINFHGLVRMTRAFLPLLKASDDARLVNISSVFGLAAPSGQAAYAASKFAVRGFSEALRHELEHTSVGVTVVFPGGVATSISERARRPAALSRDEIEQGLARSRRLLKLPPDIAGETIVKGVEQRKARVLVGSDARMVDLLVRLAPASYWSIMRRVMRR
ncbi:MAG: SDR family oxidoreductase [Roseiflexus sp.]|nr:SDR family oxidoreductase [Roseiflexus sp.]MCS7287719.1 SDR family oxidoreductase [Roseiflexus sp.]MDW8147918.1 SDR family oxidoreductase [Roseiflexaceae bacterium]MDW8231953.1 SDR family oxidoreductase [Roseiflexaceae bacterium]